MNEIIQIQCPSDGAILSIKNQAGLEGKNVTCPVCKQSRPFTQYKRYVPKTEEHTQYPGSHGQGGKEETEVSMPNLSLGRLTVVGTGARYQLRPGRNVVGRKAASSEADFQIDTGENRRMSRSQVVIEVVKVPGKGFVHQVRLFKERCNATYVNHTRLEDGDCIVLHHSDLLRLPDADVKFEIPDGEDTDF
ncbi:MAG: FHA domain-containing protein [Bacteroidaceae bacterium]